MYPLGLIFFLLCLPIHACNASRLGFVAEEIDNNHADVSTLEIHDDQPAISKQVETLEDGVQGIRTQENLMGANTMKQTLLNSLLKAKEDVSKAISSGYEIIISSRVGLHGMEKVTRSRSMLGNSGGGETEEDVDSDENESVDGDIDGVMDYSQPHRKPPIHNEKN